MYSMNEWSKSMETHGNNNGTRIVFGWGICSCPGEDLHDTKNGHMVFMRNNKAEPKTTPIFYVIFREATCIIKPLTYDILACTDQFTNRI